MKLNPFHLDFHRSRYQHGIRWALRYFARDLHADGMLSVAYARDSNTELSRLCRKYGTDKGGGAPAIHRYDDFYESIFGLGRRHVKHVLECGIGTHPEKGASMIHMGPNYAPGASLRVWRDYFPNAEVVGIDIDGDSLFSDERITTCQCDQTSPDSIRAFLDKLDGRRFDVIIDDGLHEPHANITLFENLIHRLADDGVYVIEDIYGPHVRALADYFSAAKYRAQFVQIPTLGATSRKKADLGAMLVVIHHA